MYQTSRARVGFKLHIIDVQGVIEVQVEAWVTTWDASGY